MIDPKLLSLFLTSDKTPSDTTTTKAPIDTATIPKSKLGLLYRLRDLQAINKGAKYGVDYGKTKAEIDSVSKANREQWVSNLDKMGFEVKQKEK